MGQMYEISCTLCKASAGVMEGRGMRHGNSFEDLYFNYMDQDDRFSIGMNIPSGSRNKITKCFYSHQALACVKCNAISSKLVWSIEFESGWKFIPPNKCNQCHAEVKKLPFPDKGVFKQRCWECDSETLQVELTAMWD